MEINIGEKLYCPKCQKNCHTLHQEIAHIPSDKSDQLNFSLEEKGPSALTSPKEKHRMEFQCLHCSYPCHVVVSLSPIGPQTANETDQKIEEPVSSPASAVVPAEADVKEEKSKKSTINVDGVADIQNTKLTCYYCEHSCHSLDSNGPDSVLQPDAENEVKVEQVFNSDYFVQNMICSCCENFCHRIYTQPTAQGSEAGKAEENPDLSCE